MGSNVFEQGPTKADMISLDEFLAQENPNERVGFIKFDLEGSAYRALLGSVKTLQKWKPVLSISLYHSPEEFLKAK